MSQAITLDSVTPRRSFSRKLLLGLLSILLVAVLVVSYIQSDINPLQIYQQYGKGIDYLFGREPTQSDKEIARNQADRLPYVMAFEDARHEIMQGYRARNEKPDMAKVRGRAEELAREKVAAMPAKEREAMVRREYERIVDEKRGGYFPPDTVPGHLKSYTLALLETVAIAIWGSILAVIAAIPVSMFAAQNTLALMAQGDSFKARSVRWFSRFVVRRVLDFCRGFNEFVMALIFVAVIGLGPFAGVIALAIHTFGILGKVFSEAIEAIEPGQVEAVQASGASPAQIMAFSVLPQVMPLIVSYSLLRFESNVRSATILGFVGAGGIGFLMFDKINGFLYREVCTMMIMVIVSVTVIDYFCGILRARFQ